MKTFAVCYEVRELNAIGIFWAKADSIIADNAREAFDRFRSRWQHKYEFRFPISVKEIS